MTDKVLESRINQIKEFIDLWTLFFNLYKKAHQQQLFTEEEEKNFLELKSNLARKYQGIMDSLGLKPVAEDRTFDVISQILSLKSIINLSPLQAQKMETDWHNSYINLNKIMGTLENRKAELAKINSSAELAKKLLSNPFFMLILIIIVLYFVFYFIKNFF